MTVKYIYQNETGDLKIKTLHWIVVFVTFFSLTFGSAAEPEPRKKTISKVKPIVKTVAIHLFEGVELLDFAGPAEVIIVTADGKAFRVVTVADSTKPLKSMGGVTLTPDFSYTNAPNADKAKNIFKRWQTDWSLQPEDIPDIDGKDRDELTA